MKAANIVLGNTYLATVSNVKVPVRVLNKDGKGYNVVNLRTGRTIRTASAARLLRPLNSSQVTVYLAFVS